MRLNPDFRPVIRMVLLLLIVIAGGCGGETNPAMTLQFADRVFVAVDRSAPLDGIAGVANLHLQFTHREAVFAEEGKVQAIVIYSNVRYLPKGTAYVPARVPTLFAAAMADTVAAGVVVNPGVNGAKSYVMTKPEIKAAIPRVMQNPPLPYEILVAGD